MTYPFRTTLVVCAGVAIIFATPGDRLLADDGADLKRQVEQLLEQNKALQKTVSQQQGVIESLNRRVGDIEKASSETNQKAEAGGAADVRTLDGLKFGRVNIGGEGAVAFVAGQDNSAFPESTFFVDEAKLFVEAPIWGDVYFFGELNLATRENDGLQLNLGELYLDWEDISKLWGKTRQLNLRAGRFYIPFGEEYLDRYAINNPLVSHSLSDLWGVDEGLELYGSFGKISYAVAVQNGGVPGARDYNSDKSVAGRISYDPNRWLHLSVSAMRTGDLDATDDELSEIWFGGGWFRSIGGTNTTTFHANLVQGDVKLKGALGHLHAYGGYAHYDDNDPDADNQRDFYYYAVEGVFNVTQKFYTAARFSQIFVNGGYPLPGQGDMGNYFWNPFGPAADELWRCSVGLGYRFSPHLIVKAEYSFEGGEETGG